MPHSEETFYKMKCGWASDPKVAALARFGPVEACLGRDLFGQMIDYARRELTNGLVPSEEIGRLSFPLPEGEAMQVAMRLADPGPYGALCSFDASSNAFSILAYANWNDTAEEVQARKAKGVKAAQTRWKRSDANGNAPSTLSDANGNAPSNAPGNATSIGADANGIHRARAHVHTEQEQEQEQDTSVGVDDPRAGTRPRAREDRPTDNDDQGNDDELDPLVQALMFTRTGQSVTRLEAAAIRAELLSGRQVANPASYIRSALSTKREAVKHSPHHDRRQPPPAAAVLGPRSNRAAEASRGAAKARELLAERERQREADEAADANALAALAPLMLPDDPPGRPVTDVELPDPDDDAPGYLEPDPDEPDDRPDDEPDEYPF